MKRIAVSLVAALLLAGAGCPSKTPDLLAPQTHVASAKGLTVELALDRHSFYRGEIAAVKIVVRNDTSGAVTIEADSGALARVVLSRRTAAGWEPFRRCPDSALMLARRWTLQPRASRTFPLNIEVAPDWPTGEPLKLAAEVNGRGDVRPEAVIDVYPTQAAFNRAMGLEQE